MKAGCADLESTRQEAQCVYESSGESYSRLQESLKKGWANRHVGPRDSKGDGRDGSRFRHVQAAGDEEQLQVRERLNEINGRD